MFNKLVLIGIMTIAGVSSTLLDTAQYENILSEPKVFVMKANLLNFSGDCDNKMVVPVPLPKAAKGWYYEVTLAPKGRSLKTEKALIDDLKLLSRQNMKDPIENHVTLQKTKKQANIYILRGEEYAEAFTQCDFFRQHGKFVDTKSKSGYVENTPGETFYLGIERSSEWSSVQVKVELVALK